MKRILLFLLLASNISVIYAQDQTSLRAKQFNLDGGLAINGYDPVSYFTQNKAVKGKREIAAIYQGVTYYFSSAQNRDEFKKNPSRYEPQYGGWCAYAMGAKNDKVEIDPKTFKILDVNLYLFYNQIFNNTLPAWNKDESNLKRKADVNWERLVK